MPTHEEVIEAILLAGEKCSDLGKANVQPLYLTEEWFELLDNIITGLEVARAKAEVLEGKAQIEPRTNAYTLGNPEVYDEDLENNQIAKQAGGAVFWSLEEAKEALVTGKFGHYLPKEWFPNSLPIPGAVYGLHIEDPKQVSLDTDDVGAHTLFEPALITEKVEL